MWSTNNNGDSDEIMGRIIIDPSLDDSAKNRMHYRFRRFNGAKFIETLMGRVGWIVVVMAALTLSWWSLFIVSIHYGLPVPLAAITSTAFDGAAVICCDLSLKYARTSDSGFGPRIMVFILAGISAYLNGQHAVINGSGKAGVILFGTPPVIAIAVFELAFRYQRKNALRKSGRVSKALPPTSHHMWFLFPIRTLKIIRKIVYRRLLTLDEESITETSYEWSDPKQVRAWAIAQGLSVSDKGRISNEIVQLFREKQAELDSKPADNRPNLSLIEKNTGSIEKNAESSDDNPGETSA
jgi:Lsr2 protein/uncharacterized protein DUF2637